MERSLLLDANEMHPFLTAEEVARLSDKGTHNTHTRVQAISLWKKFEPYCTSDSMLHLDIAAELHYRFQVPVDKLRRLNQNDKDDIMTTLAKVENVENRYYCCYK